MTFSKPLGSDTYHCDSCHTPVGRTWRQRADHICPRVVAFMRRTQLRKDQP